MRTGDWLPCSYCGKAVRLKAFFGLWHVCLSPEERDAIDRQRASRVAESGHALMFRHSMDEDYRLWNGTQADMNARAAAFEQNRRERLAWRQ